MGVAVCTMGIPYCFRSRLQMHGDNLMNTAAGFSLPVFGNPNAITTALPHQIHDSLYKITDPNPFCPNDKKEVCGYYEDKKAGNIEGKLVPQCSKVCQNGVVAQTVSFMKEPDFSFRFEMGEGQECVDHKVVVWRHKGGYKD